MPNRRDLTERNLPPLKRLASEVKRLDGYTKRQGKAIRRLEARVKLIEERRSV